MNIHSTLSHLRVKITHTQQNCLTDNNSSQQQHGKESSKARLAKNKTS